VCFLLRTIGKHHENGNNLFFSSFFFVFRLCFFFSLCILYDSVFCCFSVQNAVWNLVLPERIQTFTQIYKTLANIHTEIRNNNFFLNFFFCVFLFARIKIEWHRSLRARSIWIEFWDLVECRLYRLSRSVFILNFVLLIVFFFVFQVHSLSRGFSVFNFFFSSNSI